MTLPLSEQEIINLRENEPDKYFEFIAQLAQRITPDQAKEARLDALAQIARSDSLEAFDAFYEGIHDAPMLPHLRQMEAESFQAFEQGRIWVCLGFRGSRKTTTNKITKKAWLHGLYPEKTGVTTGANDKNSSLISASIAQIIKNHPFFKRCFPYVATYEERGWGSEGYWIRKTHEVKNGALVEIPITEWVARQAKVNDPSFVGGGYKSSIINGKHPTLYLDVDDLHDIDSSASVTEREGIKNVFEFQILPTVPRENDKLMARVEITGVPFADNDTYAEQVKSGAYFTKMPIMKKAKEGEGVYIDGIDPMTGVVYEDLVGWWILTAPTLFSVKSIMQLRRKKAVFYQMYMIDINQAKTGGLIYYEYSQDIGFNLPTVGGADPSGVDPDYEVGGSKRSSFALCFLCKLPNGGAVVKDGVLKPMGFEKAKMEILRAQSMFTNWETTAIEDVSYGKSFMQYLRTDSKIRFVKSNLKDIETNRVNNKKVRFLNEVYPYIESGLIRIAPDKTPFLDAIRFLMDNFWDIDDNKPHESLDAADSLYHAVKFIPEVLRIPVHDNINPMAMNNRGGLWHPLTGNRYGR